MNKNNRKYIKEGRIHLINGSRIRERYIFLFTDLMLIAKEKALNTFCLKDKIAIGDIWLSENGVESIVDAVRRLDCCFVIGWPEENFVAETASSEERQCWYSAIKSAVDCQRSITNGRTTTVTVTAELNGRCRAKEITVGRSTLASQLLRMAAEQLDIPTVEIYQLHYDWPNRVGSFPLYGFEVPYNLHTSRLRAKLSAIQEGDAPNLDIIKEGKSGGYFVIKLKDENQCIANGRTERSAYGMMHELRKRTKRINGVNDKHLLLASKFFGHKLSDMVIGDRLSPQLEKLFAHLLTEGVQTASIFRKPPKQSTFQTLKEMLDIGSDVDFTAFSPCVSASLLKELLRRLPESALCGKNYTEWLCICNLDDNQKRIEKCKLLIESLPNSSVVFLKHLTSLCRLIAENSSVNQMDTHSLSICIGPSLLQSSKIHSSVEDVQARKIAEVTEFFLINSEALLGIS